MVSRDVGMVFRTPPATCVSSRIIFLGLSSEAVSPRHHCLTTATVLTTVMITEVTGVLGQQPADPVCLVKFDDLVTS